MIIWGLPFRIKVLLEKKSLFEADNCTLELLWYTIYYQNQSYHP